MGYRKLATRSIALWALVAVAARLPIATAPLALVFLVRESAGGYSLGATLAGTYVVGEVVGALVIGTRQASRRRGLLAAGLAVGAAAFGGLAAVPSAPAVVLVLLALVAGAAPAASPGGMRTMLTGLVDEADVPSAISAEAVLTQAIWACAPALVVLLALGVGASMPMALGGICAASAAVLMFLLPSYAPASGVAKVTGQGRILASAWPIYLTSAAAMALLSSAELALIPLLEFRNLPIGWSGVLLAVLALSSAVGAFIYGLRSWPGSIRTQSLVLLVVMSACMALTAVMPGLIGIGAILVAAGVVQAGVMVTRNLSLRQRLPASAHTAGYSVMYAIQGVGYSVTATVTATVLVHFTPVLAVLGGAAITLLLTLASALAELKPSAHPTLMPKNVAT